MTEGVVTFNYTTWAYMFPEFAPYVGAPVATEYFADAGLFLANTPCSLIQDLAKRGRILNWITAHIAALFAPLNGQPSSTLVGRISNATEGSVSVATELEGMGKNEAWWTQTKYGLTAWQMMAPYRTGLYVAPPQIPLSQQSYPRYPYAVGPFGPWGFQWPR